MTQSKWHGDLGSARKRRHHVTQPSTLATDLCFPSLHSICGPFHRCRVDFPAPDAAVSALPSSVCACSVPPPHTLTPSRPASNAPGRQRSPRASVFQGPAAGHPHAYSNIIIISNTFRTSSIRPKSRPTMTIHYFTRHEPEVTEITVYASLRSW